MQDSIRLARCLLRGEIYLGPALAAMQGVFRHQFFFPTAKIVSERFSDPIRILEIGSWAGASAITWAKAFIELGCSVTIDCVDQWQPYFDLSRETGEHYQQMNEATASKEIYALFQHNLRAAGINDHVTVRYGSSTEVLPKLNEKSYHLIFIDGSHLYPDVLSDIREAKRLVREGGIICGDDLEIQANELPAQELLQSVKSGRDSATSSGGGQLYHPGVTAAVADELGCVSAWDGYWAIGWDCGKTEKIMLDLAAAKLPIHIQREYDEILIRESSTPKLIGVFEGFNLISFKHQIFGVHQTSGPVNLDNSSVSEINELKKNYMCITGESLAEVKTEILRAIEIISTKINAPKLIGEFKKFNLISFNEQFFGIRQSVGPLDIANLSEAEINEMKRNRTYITGESLSDVLVKISSACKTFNPDCPLGHKTPVLNGFLMESIRDFPYFSMRCCSNEQSGFNLEDSIPKRIGKFEGFNLVLFKKQYVGIHQSIGSVDIANLGESEIHEMEKSGMYITGKLLSDVKIEILNTLRITNFKGNSPKHIIELEGFNLLFFNDRFLGIHQSVGQMNLAELSEFEIHEMKKSGAYITGESLSDVLTRILNAPKTFSFEDSIPRRIGEFEGFNLVFLKNRYFGMRQSLGPTNLADLSELALDEMKKSGICIVGTSAFDVKKKILSKLPAQSERAA